MKCSFGKLRRFAIHKNDAKDNIEFLPLAQLDELSQAAQDMQDMRDRYDSLLSAAAATANSAYEFSESLRDMGACLMENSSSHDDEESGNALLSLGKVQVELQKLVDNYRSHIFQTITTPSESLLNELRTVEEMKRQCDEKRNVYEYMMAQQREKGRSKSGKHEGVTSQQLQTAHDEFEEEATLCVFRLKSLKQGQYRSLLTQATRHHAAQLNFFRKGLKSLEVVEPHVRLITELQHIDYQFSGLEDGEHGENHYNPTEYGEISFAYRSKQGLDFVSTLRNSLEVDQADISFPQASTVENAEVSRELRLGSHSAPLFAEKKTDPAEKVRQIQPSSTRKYNTCVLPTPVDVKGFMPTRKNGSEPRTRSSYVGGHTHNLWHSSPLEEKRHEKYSAAGKFSGLVDLTQPVLKESNGNRASTQLPSPLVEGQYFPQVDMFGASDTKKIRSQALSAPLTSKPLSTKPGLSTSGPISSTEISQHISGVLSSIRITRNSQSPKVSPTASPRIVSSPKISELHELPRPPCSLAVKPKSPGHSAPFAFREQELSASNKIPSVAPNASPLPTPPLIIPQSFSVPLRSQGAKALHVTNLVETHQVPDNAQEVASPPLTPLSLANIKTG